MARRDGCSSKVVASTRLLLSVVNFERKCNLLFERVLLIGGLYYNIEFDLNNFFIIIHCSLYMHIIYLQS